MTENNIYSEINRNSRNELISFIQQLSDKQLAHEMPAGWSVLAVLTHLAFWDLRALILIKKWQSEGITHSIIDTDVINEVSRPLLLAIDPTKGKQLVIDVAEEIDLTIESLSPQFINDIEEKGKTVHLNRAKHRLMHIAEIKKALTVQ